MEKRHRKQRITAPVFAVFLLALLSLLAGGGTGTFLDTTAWAKPVADQPVPQWPHETSDLKPDPALVFGRLPNGFRYVLMQNDTPEDRVSMHLNVQAGSMHETDEQQGLAHFLEHMMFNGSENFPPGEMVRFFQRIGMEFGPDANAHTGFYETVYDVLLPEGDRKNLADGLMVMKDYARGALLLPEEVDRERRVILEEMRARDSASYRTFRETFKFELPGFRLPKRLPIGEKAVLETADRALLKDYYDTWYRPEQMVLVMVGDVDLKMAEKMIRERFRDIQPRAPRRAEPDPGDFDHTGKKAFYHHEKEAGNTQVTVQVLDEIVPEPDSLAWQKQSLIRSIADQIVQNRLRTMLKKPETPFTDATVGSGIFLKYVKYGVLAAETDPGKWEETLSTLEQALRQALKYGFTEAELERVRKDYLAGLDRAVKNASTRESNRLARQIIRNINGDRVFQSPAQEKALYAPIIRDITLDEVYAAFKSVWAADHRLVMVTGNSDLNGEEKAPEEMILAAYDQSEAVAVAKPEAEELVAFPYLPEPEKPGKIAEKRELEDLGIVQIDFENGFRLNLKKTDFEANSVIANLAFGAGGSTEPADKPGLSGLSEAVLNESGLGQMDRDQLERALAGKSTGVRFNIKQDRFLFQGSTVSDEIPLMFQLFYAYLNDPGYRKDAYELVMARYDQMYRKLTRTIEGAMTLQGEQFLAGGDSRFGMPPYDTFRTLTLEDVKEWTRKPISEAPLELSIVGDFDVEEVTELATRYFGSMKARTGTAETPRAQKPHVPKGEALSLDVNTKIPKGMVRVVYPTDDMWDIQRTRRLSTLASVFSDRLREVVREKLGATYSPYAYNNPSRAYPDYGLFQAVISVNPDEADRVVTAVKEISADLAKNGVTDEELRRAVDPTLTGIKDMRQQNSYWLNTVLTGSREHPEQIEWSTTIQEDYAAITAEEVSKLAKTYLQNDSAAVIRIRPSQEIAEKAGEETATDETGVEG